MCNITVTSSAYRGKEREREREREREGAKGKGGDTVDREIFALQIIHVKIFRGVKFSWFCSICKNFLAVDDYNVDECLESFWCLVYYQVSGEPGIAGCI